MLKTELDTTKLVGSSCTLDLGSSRHACRLDRITPAGARVICLGFLRETLRGDRAMLHLPAGSGDIACTVADIAEAKITLRFAGGEARPASDDMTEDGSRENPSAA